MKWVVSTYVGMMLIAALPEVIQPASAQQLGAAAQDRRAFASVAGGSDAPIVSATGQCASTPPLPTPQPASVGITVAERVETPHLAKLSGDAEQPLVSPDGRAYALFVVRSDLAKDGQWLDILIGRMPATGRAAEPPRCLVSLFTDARRYDYLQGAHDHIESTYPYDLNPVWLADDRRLAFTWSSGPAAAQLISVDVETGGLSQLTHSGDSLYYARVSADGKVIAYSAVSARDWDAHTKLYHKGFAVSSADWREIYAGHYDGVEPWTHLSQHIQFGDQTGDANGVRFTSSSTLSPNGQYLVTPLIEVAAPPDRWKAFKAVEAGRVYETRVFDLTTGRSWLLVDAPEPLYVPNLPRRMVWSPDGGRLLIGRTYVPGPAASAAGRAGEATAVIDLPTGRIVELPVPDQYRDYTPLAWEKGDILILSKGGSRVRFAPAAKGWRFEGTAPRSVIKVVQDINRPPALVTGAARGTPQVLLEIAPMLESHRLGQVKLVNWTDLAGHGWRGRLYLPPDYVAGHRYPLVIQTHGVPPEGEFSLSGGIDAVDTAGYAAQALATRGMAVLQMPDPDPIIEGTPKEPEQFLAMLTGAIVRLTADGIADAKRVGLMGFSRTCWHLEYTLTQSHLEIAAAEAADGMDASYISGTLAPYYKGYGAVLGAPPFGAGLSAWLEHSPGFTVERIRAPLAVVRIRGRGRLGAL